MSEGTLPMVLLMASVSGASTRQPVGQQAVVDQVAKQRLRLRQVGDHAGDHEQPAEQRSAGSNRPHRTSARVSTAGSRTGRRRRTGRPGRAAGPTPKATSSADGEDDGLDQRPAVKLRRPGGRARHRRLRQLPAPAPLPADDTPGSRRSPSSDGTPQSARKRQKSSWPTWPIRMFWGLPMTVAAEPILVAAASPIR